MNMMLKNKKIILLYILCMVVVVTSIFTTRNVIKKINKEEKQAKEIKTAEKISYEFYKVYNGEICILIHFLDNEKGIDTIYYPNNEQILKCNNRKEVSIDYKIYHEPGTSKDYTFKLINSEEEEYSKTITINDETLNNLLPIEVSKINDFIYKVEIDYASVATKKYYKIPAISDSYVSSNGTFIINSLKAKRYTDENGMITIYIRQEDDVGNIVEEKKVIQIIDERKEIEAESLLSLIEENDIESGYYKFKVNDEIYDVHFYAYEGNQTWDSMTFGDEYDTSIPNDTEHPEYVINNYANNTVVVKVNGDLTINEGAIITSYKASTCGPKGMIIYCTGTLTNNGLISMTERGGWAPGQNVYLWKNQIEGTDTNGVGGQYEYIPALGVDGAISNSTSTSTYRIVNPNMSNAQGVGRKTAGGASGGAGKVGSGFSAKGGNGRTRDFI